MKFKRGDVIKAFDAENDWAIYKIVSINPPRLRLIQNGPHGWCNENPGAPWTKSDHGCDTIEEVAISWQFEILNKYNTKLGKILYK